MNDTKENILVVEDDMQIRNFICYSVRNEGYNCKIAVTGTQAINTVLNESVDVIILDLGLPDIDGIDVINEIRQWSEIPIIVVSARDQDKEKAYALDMGADDYISKPFGVMELVSRVKALLRRCERKESATVLEYENIKVDDFKHTVSVNGEPCVLTYKEYELLKYLIVNKDIVLTREKLLEKVWGYDFSGESRTVDAHIKTLRQKLGDSGSIIKTVRHVGYKVGE